MGGPQRPYGHVTAARSKRACVHALARLVLVCRILQTKVLNLHRQHGGGRKSDIWARGAFAQDRGAGCQSEAVPVEGELSAVRGDAFAHNVQRDLVATRKSARKSSPNPGGHAPARQRDPALNNVRAHVNARWPQTTLYNLNTQAPQPLISSHRDLARNNARPHVNATRPQTIRRQTTTRLYCKRFGGSRQRDPPPNE